ncbi:hypothetical protein [Sansalvadorimonas verongulae]|uniref:hypothetical protein n=1 Tax=Sansalvadorimonas verongulae TaxID=2172824 RepID=UPI0012BBD157|nr:hypothetical protein [Sansalvadorimonas verongulae]MTI14882.1 hypothetical protein [Sansalvadorimonas verongulae]
MGLDKINQASNPLPPVDAEEVTGPVNAGQHPTLGSVKTTEAEPRLAGKNLGKHIAGKGVKGWVLTFLKHPKSTLHLISGELGRMRATNPTQYLEELSGLCSTKSDWTFLFNEGQSLKADAHPDVKNQLEGWQFVALGEFANQAPGGLVPAFTQHLKEFTELSTRLGTKIPFRGSNEQPDTGLLRLDRLAQRVIPSANTNSIMKINNLLTKACACIDNQSSQRTPLSRPLQTAREKVTAAAEMQGNPTPLPENENMPPPHKRFAWKVSQKPHDDIKTIQEENFPKELEGIQSTLLENPDDVDAWELFDEIEGELPLQDKTSFLEALYDAHPDNVTVAKFLVFHGLPAAPHSANLWDVFDRISDTIPLEAKIAFLEPMYRQNNDNTVVTARLLDALQNVARTSHYDQLLDDIIKNH